MKIFVAISLLFFLSGRSYAQHILEKLNRGLVAIPSGNGYYLSWRLLGTDASATAFNVYKGATKLNATPLTTVTNYNDNTSGTGVYTVRPVFNNTEQAASEPARVLTTNYLSFPLQIPAGGSVNGSSYTYSANDASVGDMDGDGEYEVVLKWDPSNARDNSQSGYSGPQILDAYKLDGTRLWRINLGLNIRAGAHYTQFLVYDFDGDGRAEVMCKTADGTVDGAGVLIGSGTANWSNTSGYILSGPEFLTVFDGRTGRALATTNYAPPRGDVGSWGGVGGNAGTDTYGNRVDRFLATVAYLDGVRPSAVFTRGYYGKSVLAAWDWRNGQLTQRWLFNSAAWDSLQPTGSKLYSAQGAHSISVADVDADGKDEIVFGAMTVDDNGTGLYSTGLRHGDALHVGDLDPARPGLEVFMIHENEAPGNTSPGEDLHDAKTGQVYWSTPIGADVGRGVSADIDATRLGDEMWANSIPPRDVNGVATGAATPSSTNFAVWWDGDLSRELEDGTSITKVGGGTLLTATGCASNNGTKSTPALSADLFGDWREEVMWRTSDNSAMRIYMTTTPSTYRFHTLMHDSHYRMAISWQNAAYNQPPHLSYFLGTGMTTPPPPNITTTNPTAIFRIGSLHALQPVGVEASLYSLAGKHMAATRLGAGVWVSRKNPGLRIFPLGSNLMK